LSLAIKERLIELGYEYSGGGEQSNFAIDIKRNQKRTYSCVDLKYARERVEFIEGDFKYSL